MECINCGHTHQAVYCPKCGEKSGTEPITFQSILASAIGTLTSMDKGFLYNIKQLWLAPQSLIRQYLAGRRRGIFNPLSYVIVATSLYLILDSFVGSSHISLPRSHLRNDFAYDQGIEAGRFLRGQLKFFWLLNIFFLSVFTKLFFKKYNFFEHVSINAFIIGQATLLGILFVPLKLPIIFNPLVALTMVILLYKVYKGDSNRLALITRSSFAVFLSYLMFFIIPFLIVFLS